MPLVRVMELAGHPLDFVVDGGLTGAMREHDVVVHGRHEGREDELGCRVDLRET